MRNYSRWTQITNHCKNYPILRVCWFTLALISFHGPYLWVERPNVLSKSRHFWRSSKRLWRTVTRTWKVDQLTHVDLTASFPWRRPDSPWFTITTWLLDAVWKMSYETILKRQNIPGLLFGVSFCVNKFNVKLEFSLALSIHSPVPKYWAWKPKVTYVIQVESITAFSGNGYPREMLFSTENTLSACMIITIELRFWCTETCLARRVWKLSNRSEKKIQNSGWIAAQKFI